MYNKSMNRGFWAIIAVIVVIFGGIILFGNNNNGTNGSGSSNSNVQPTEHKTGEGKADVTLLEYADYQCPFCGEMYPIVKQAVEKYKDQITYQFRNLPLTSIHQNAFAAARAAEAADMQGKFWEMHDLIYQNQSEWSYENNSLTVFTKYAQSLGLNTDQFKKDFASSKVNDLINADINEFKKTGADMATPTFFIDGKQVVNTPTSLDDLSKIIDAAISAKNKAQ